MSTTVGNLSIELGISDAQLRAGLAQAVVQAQQAGQKIANSMNQASSKASGINPQGLLAISRAADDLQYGLRGVINNIEGIVTGLGGGAALAGGFTLAAIAINAFGDDIAAATVKMMDGRSELQRLSDQAQYASSIFGRLKASIETSTNELKKLAEYDANAGFSGFVNRQTGENTNAMNAMAAFSFASISENVAQQQRELNRRSSAYAAGADFLDPAMNQNKEKNDLRAAAVRQQFDTDFRRQSVFGKLTEQLATNEFGGNYTMARQRAREIIGQAAQGLNEGFQILDKVSKGQLERTRIKILTEQNQKEEQKVAEKQATEQAKAIDDNMSRLASEFRQRQKIEAERSGLISKRDELEMRRQATEILGGTEAFTRNFGAGTVKDPVVTAIEELGDKIVEANNKLKELN